MGRLSGKVAIITGAASGQGAVEARLFADEGAKVIATDLNETLLNEVVAEINAKHGDVALALSHNVAEESDWIRVVEDSVAKFGKVNVLVNNAGISGKIHALEEITVEEWHKVMNINALGNFLGMKHVVPAMKNAGGGSIVNISSLAGINGYGSLTPYAASKGATRILTKGAANQLGPDNIRVNSVHPGFVDTPMIAEYTSNEEAYNYLVSAIPLRTIAQPEDIAYSVIYLASDEARFVTGEELIIDGGQSIKE